MKTKVKQLGNSKGIVLSPEFLESMNLEVGDWVDCSDLVKAKINNKKNENETKE